jgi:hypothetical protein
MGDALTNVGQPARASYAHLGKLEETRQHAVQLMKVHPNFSIDGMRKAGLKQAGVIRREDGSSGLGPSSDSSTRAC